VFFSLIIRNKLIIFKSQPEEIISSLESDFGRILITFQKDTNGYILELQGGAVPLKLLKPWFGIYLISFGEGWEQKKIYVLKALIVKSYKSIFPRLTIHLTQHVKNN
jgi:hypothetical protein